MALINNQTNKPCLSGPSQSSVHFSPDFFISSPSTWIFSQISFLSSWNPTVTFHVVPSTGARFSPLSPKMANSYTSISTKEREEERCKKATFIEHLLDLSVYIRISFNDHVSPK